MQGVRLATPPPSRALDPGCLDHPLAGGGKASAQTQAVRAGAVDHPGSPQARRMDVGPGQQIGGTPTTSSPASTPTWAAMVTRSSSGSAVAARSRHARAIRCLSPSPRCRATVVITQTRSTTSSTSAAAREPPGTGPSARRWRLWRPPSARARRRPHLGPGRRQVPPLRARGSVSACMRPPRPAPWHGRRRSRSTGRGRAGHRPAPRCRPRLWLGRVGAFVVVAQSATKRGDRRPLLAA